MSHDQPQTDEDVRSAPADEGRMPADAGGERTTAPANDEGSAPQRPSLRRRLQRPLLALAVLAIPFAGWRIWSELQADQGLAGWAWSQMSGREPSAGVRQSPFEVFDLSEATIPEDRIHHGGPPVDGIPAISEPKFVTAEQAAFLEADDRVIGVALGGEARAYPLRILNYHEAVNDAIGETPFAVTYCPLCDSAAVFDRRLGQDVVEFGISGLLFNSNVLLYDRRAENSRQSLWSQMQTASVAGPSAKQELRTLPLELTTWRDWAERHPKTVVLSTETGHDRDYARSPYAGYFGNDRLMFPVEPLDERLPVKEPVLGVWTEDASRAYPLSTFEDATGPTEFDDRLGGKTVTLLYDPAANSLRVRDADDGVQWAYSFWFAWAAFHPQTSIFEGPAS